MAHTRPRTMARRHWTLALALFAWAPSSGAQDTVTQPFPGVRRLHRVLSGQNLNVLFVDLCAPGVSLRVTAPSERTRTVPSFGALVGAQAAVNGGFYNTRDPSMTDGYVLHNGASWGGADHNYTGPIAFGDGRAEIIPHERVAAPAAWMREAVEGHPTLIVDGVARDNSGDTGLCPRNPRTAVGFSADGHTLLVAVVDGRSAPSRLGMTCNELASLMAGLGARQAMNLDGGGSSTMWLAGPGVLNRPSDGSARTVSNHLAIFARGSGAAPHCPTPRFRAQYVMQTFPLARTTLDLSPGQLFPGFLEMRNTGSETWTPARTRLGTTQPRDRMSLVAGPDWLSPHRPAAIDRRVAPGMTGRFAFTIRAPLRPGEYGEYFNLLEEGVAWFSDPGQGGPVDNIIQVRVRTLADASVPMDAASDVPLPDTTEPDTTEPDTTAADTTVSEVSAPEVLDLDATVSDATEPDTTALDELPGAFADALDAPARPDGAVDEAPATLPPEGCGCRATSPRLCSPWTMALALASLARRRSRRAG